MDSSFLHVLQWEDPNMGQEGPHQETPMERLEILMI